MGRIETPALRHALYNWCSTSRITGISIRMCHSEFGQPSLPGALLPGADLCLGDLISGDLWKLDLILRIYIILEVRQIHRWWPGEECFLKGCCLLCHCFCISGPLLAEHPDPWCHALIIYTFSALGLFRHPLHAYGTLLDHFLHLTSVALTQSLPNCPGLIIADCFIPVLVVLIERFGVSSSKLPRFLHKGSAFGGEIGICPG